MNLENLLNNLLKIPDFFLEFAIDLLFISCRRIELSDCLANWIDRHMPDVGGVRTISIYCCDPGDLPLGPIFKVVDGITLGEHIGLSAARGLCPVDPCDLTQVRALLHELVHVEQYKGTPGFFARYVAQFVIGALTGNRAYHDHPDEVAARNRGDHLLQEYRRDNPCGCWLGDEDQMVGRGVGEMEDHSESRRSPAPNNGHR